MASARPEPGKTFADLVVSFIERTRLQSLTPLFFFLVRPQVAFFLLALAVMGPLLAPGRLLTLDLPLALNFDISGYFWGTTDGPASVFAATYNSAPIAFILKVFSFVLPFWLVEKAWLVLLFWLCGVGASRLPFVEGIGRYYAGLFYAVNPFTYIRFVAGQWGILGAYALIPFAVNSFVHLLEEPRPGHAIKVALLLTAIGFFQIHGLALACLVLGALYLGRIAAVPGSFRSTLPVLLLSAFLFLGVNAFWIVRYAIAGGGVTQNMPVAELSYFAAFPPFDVLSLRASWLPGIYLDVSDLVGVWWLFFLPLLFLATYGAITMWGVPRLRWLILGLALTALIGLVLAMGPGVPAFRPLFQWLWEHLPWYRAFRDSHKFVALLALVYAYFGALGLQAFRDAALRSSLRVRWLAPVGSGLLLVFVVAYALPIFGTWGQVRPTRFPADWQVARSILNTDTGDYNVLVLPWHMYLDFEWLPNRWKNLVNPASDFFAQPVISGDNLEIAANFSDSSNPQSKYVEFLLGQRESLQGFGELIVPLNAKYVVLFKTADYGTYSFLGEQDDLEKVFEGPTIALFRNLRPTARVYVVNDVVNVSNLDDYLKDPSRQDPLGNLYVLGSGSREFLPGDRDESSSAAKLEVVEVNPLSYHVEHSSSGYLVLALPQRTAPSGWKHDGRKSDLKNLGMMPSFQVAPGKSRITFTRFYELYLPTYVLAAISLVAAAFVYRRWS